MCTTNDCLIVPFFPSGSKVHAAEPKEFSIKELMSSGGAAGASTQDDINIFSPEDRATPSTRIGTESSSLAERVLESATMLSTWTTSPDEGVSSPSKQETSSRSVPHDPPVGREVRTTTLRGDRHDAHDTVLARVEQPHPADLREEESSGSSAAFDGDFLLRSTEEVGGASSSKAVLLARPPAAPSVLRLRGDRARTTSSTILVENSTTTSTQKERGRLSRKTNCVATFVWWLISAPVVPQQDKENLRRISSEGTRNDSCGSTGGRSWGVVVAFLTCRRRPKCIYHAKELTSIIGLPLPQSSSGRGLNEGPTMPVEDHQHRGAPAPRPQTTTSPHSAWENKTTTARRLRAFLSGAPVGGAGGAVGAAASPGREFAGRFCISSRLLQDHVFNSKLEACLSPEEVLDAVKRTEPTTFCCRRRQQTISVSNSCHSWRRVLLSPWHLILWRFWRGHVEVWHENLECEEGVVKKCLVVKYQLGFGLRSRQVMFTVFQASLKFPHHDHIEETEDIEENGGVRPATSSTSANNIDEFFNNPNDLFSPADGLPANWVDNIGERPSDPFSGVEYKVSALFRHCSPLHATTISASTPRDVDDIVPAAPGGTGRTAAAGRLSRGGRCYNSNMPPGEVRLVIQSVTVTALRSWTMLEDGNVRDEMVGMHGHFSGWDHVEQGTMLEDGNGRNGHFSGWELINEVRTPSLLRGVLFLLRQALSDKGVKLFPLVICRGHFRGPKALADRGVFAPFL